MLYILSLCDHTANMLKPWAAAGYRCIAVDIQNEPRTEGNIKYVQADVREYVPPSVPFAAVFAFPPCTHLAVSGSRWFKRKGLRALAEAIELVGTCNEICERVGVPFMIENPISTLATYWRKPDYKFDPCEYGGYLLPPGDTYTKKTCLWTGNGFVMPERRPVEPSQGSKMHFVPPGPERANIRSETPKGFAQAVFEANHKGG